MTSQIDNLLIPFAGAFTGTPAEGLKETVLIHTSKDSQQVDRFMAEFSGEQTAKDFTPLNKEQAIAIRLTGKFKTAFPNGEPEEKKEDAKDNQKKPDTSLKETKENNSVVLIGDYLNARH